MQQRVCGETLRKGERRLEREKRGSWGVGGRGRVLKETFWNAS